MATVSSAMELLPYGAVEEKKKLIGIFVDRAELDPVGKTGEVYL